VEHDLFGKPTSAFPNHALTRFCLLGRLEGNAKLIVGSPDDAAGAAGTAVLESQVEGLGHAERAREFQARPAAGEVSTVQ
jgi:hypothetical protein